MTYKVLLVDDEPGIRNVLGIYLNDAGYDVSSVGDGKQAKALFEKLVPDIVLTDIRMPGLNGIELLKIIKAAHPDTEVIMITGHGDMEIAIESLKMDAVDFIEKPVSNDSLDIALKRACEKIEMRKTLASYTENLEDLVREKTGKLEESQRKYAQLFNESPCYITIQDKNLKIIETNRLFKKHFTSKSDVFCHTVYMNRKAPCDSCPVLKTFNDGKSHFAEKIVKIKNGSLINVLVQTSPITDASGTIIHVMEMSTDISEIRNLQNHLASLGLQISSISHDMKGLLTGLDGGSYLVDSGLKKKEPEQVSEGWEIVKTKIDEIRSMVLNILYHAKQREVNKKEIKISAVISNLEKTVQPLMDEHRIQFDINLPGNDRAINIDKMMLTVALTNILENCVDACKSIKNRKPEIKLSAAVDESTIRFVIRDNGKGIPEDKKDLIFSLFYSDKGNKGTGLGLFIADRSVKQHNGSIHIDSRENRFTEFIITLPA